MTPHWSWGLSTALLLSWVIWLNGQRIRAGWLLGALVQLVNMTFGWLIYRQWTFAFLAIPAAMFLWNWWRHPIHKSRRRTPRGSHGRNYLPHLRRLRHKAGDPRH